MEHHRHEKSPIRTFPHRLLTSRHFSCLFWIPMVCKTTIPQKLFQVTQSAWLGWFPSVGKHCLIWKLLLLTLIILANFIFRKWIGMIKNMQHKSVRIEPFLMIGITSHHNPKLFGNFIHEYFFTSIDNLPDPHHFTQPILELPIFLFQLSRPFRLFLSNGNRSLMLVLHFFQLFFQFLYLQKSRLIGLHWDFVVLGVQNFVL